MICRKILEYKSCCPEENHNQEVWSQLSLVMKNNQVYLNIIMKSFKKTIQSNRKINNFNLFATSANDKKECQMSVLNRWGLIQSPSHPSDLPIVKGSCNPQLKIKIFSTDWDHILKHSMSTQNKKMQSS